MRTSMVKAAALAMLVVCSGCASLKDRGEEELNRKIWTMKIGGRDAKPDFVREFGKPSSCVALTAGEQCDWVSDLKTGEAISGEPGSVVAGRYQLLRVQFSAEGRMVDARVKIHP